ncbi:MAG: TolC family protein [Oligoflexus sp.]|nr:TolC family protein [Oligoflexus sp.]
MDLRPFPLLILAAVSLAALQSCASYSAMPLPETSSLISNLETFPKRAELEAKGVNFVDGINSTEFVTLALELSPELQLVRDDERIAERSMLGSSSGSNLSLGYGDILGQKIGTFDAGMGFDINSLVSMPSRKRQERDERRRGSLARIWQEWQVAEQARIVFAKYYFQSKILSSLMETSRLINEKIEHMDEALREGEVAISIVAVELSSRSDIISKINDAEKAQLQNASALAALLGSSPDLKLDLQYDLQLKTHSDEEIAHALESLPRRRPDLAALQISYKQEEEKVYQAVLAQFPSLTVGFTRSRDNSNVTDSIVGITLNIPIFYRGRDGVRLEEATRQKQWDEYQIRLNQSVADLKRLVMERRLLVKQIEMSRLELPRLEKASKQANAALIAGNIDALTYSDIRMAYLNKKIESFTLDELLIDREISIETLIGNELPGAGE